jgi:hypothetical protein
MAPNDPATTADADYETYKLLLDLWKNENPIKTNKLQVLLAVNALLISGLQVSGHLVARDSWFVYVAGATFSVIWTLSIGRTSLFQEIWHAKLRGLQQRHATDPRFQLLDTHRERAAAPALLRYFGVVPSKWYLLFSPFVFAACWLILLVIALSR